MTYKLPSSNNIQEQASFRNKPVHIVSLIRIWISK